jgi:hypothetical protein
MSRREGGAAGQLETFLVTDKSRKPTTQVCEIAASSQLSKSIVVEANHACTDLLLKNAVFFTLRACSLDIAT